MIFNTNNHCDMSNIKCVKPGQFSVYIRRSYLLVFQKIEDITQFTDPTHIDEFYSHYIYAGVF